jgi:hypothetical protein
LTWVKKWREEIKKWISWIWSGTAIIPLHFEFHPIGFEDCDWESALWYL